MPSFKLSPFNHHLELVKQVTPKLSYTQQKAGKKQKLNIWQNAVRKAVAELTGFKRMSQETRAPLRVRSLWKREDAVGTTEKIVISVEKGCDANVFISIPHARKKGSKMPWIICLQGHSTGAHNSVRVDRDDNSKIIEVAGDRDFAYSAMANGVAAISIEQRGFGERRPILKDTLGCYMPSMQALHLGRTMIAERVYDVDRVIDYLETRDDVDRKRIGVMGNSGGGTTTLFAAAMLKRLSFAMPSCYFCTFQHSILSIHHCLCNFVPGLQLEAEMSDILGSFAPKPVVVVAGKEDDIFPIKAVRKSFRDLKQVYEAAGAGDKLKLVVGDGGHRFYADAAWKALHRVIDLS